MDLPKQIAQTEATISDLRDQIRAHQDERSGLTQALAAVKPNGRDPAKTIEAGQRRQSLTAQVQALDEAINLLQADQARAEQQLTELQADQAAAEQQATVEAAQSELQALGSDLAAAVSEVELVLQKIWSRWQAADPSFRALQRPPEWHHKPENWRPKLMMDGVVRYGLPRLSRRGDGGFSLTPSQIDLMEDQNRALRRKLQTRGGYAGNDRTTDVRPTSETHRRYSQAELSKMSPAERCLHVQGYMGPRKLTPSEVAKKTPSDSLMNRLARRRG